MNVRDNHAKEMTGQVRLCFVKTSAIWALQYGIDTTVETCIRRLQTVLSLKDAHLV